MNNQNHNSTQEIGYLDIIKLSRSKSTNPSINKRSKSSLMRRNSNNDSILGIHSYFDKDLPPPPPYSDSDNLSVKADTNSTTITTTTTTTVTTVTTTTISNPGEPTSKQQLNISDMNPSNNNNNNNNDIEVPKITIVSYETLYDTSKDETEITTPSPPGNEILSENSNPVNLNVSNFSHHDNNIDSSNSQKHHRRTGSAPNIHVALLKEQTENKYKKNTVPSARSMVNLPDTRRDTFLNNYCKETPQQYLEKLRDTLSKSELATLLTKSKDVFHETVLRTYMETFEFTKDPIDIALR